MMKLNKINLRIIQGQRIHQTNQGFLLLDVLVAIFLTILLTGIAMGVVVMATAVKVRGDELSDATRWIQEDIEDIKIVANKLDAVDPNAATVQYSTLTRCTPTGTGDGYANLLMNPPSTTFLNGGTTIAASNTFSKTSASGARIYSLVRTSTVKNVTPYNILEVTYNVTNASGTVVSTAYAEVIPGASFYCK
jgi:type II secretory pathway pseudopilin PulG